METFAIVTYIISSEILKILEVSDDHQAQMTNAAQSCTLMVLTIALNWKIFFKKKIFSYLQKRERKQKIAFEL